jgi:hypothetical protein
VIVVSVRAGQEVLALARPAFLWLHKRVKRATEKMQPQKRGRPATGKGLPVQVRLQPDLLAALDSAMPDLQESSRPEAIRRILRDWLIGHGFLKDGQ